MADRSLQWLDRFHLLHLGGLEHRRHLARRPQRQLWVINSRRPFEHDAPASANLLARRAYQLGRSIADIPDREHDYGACEN